MEAHRRLEERIPQPYSIPKEQFQDEGRNVHEIKGYVFPEEVTRENFVHFLSLLFARSQGKTPALWAEVKWLEIHRNFDYLTTFDNFLEQGGSSTFSPEEYDYFEEQINKVPKHTKATQKISLLNGDLERTIMRVIDPNEQDGRFKQRFSVDLLTSLKTPSDLLLVIGDYLRIAKL